MKYLILFLVINLIFNKKFGSKEKFPADIKLSVSRGKLIECRGKIHYDQNIDSSLCKNDKLGLRVYLESECARLPIYKKKCLDQEYSYIAFRTFTPDFMAVDPGIFENNYMYGTIILENNEIGTLLVTYDYNTIGYNNLSNLVQMINYNSITYKDKMNSHKTKLKNLISDYLLKTIENAQKDSSKEEKIKKLESDIKNEQNSVAESKIELKKMYDYTDKLFIEQRDKTTKLIPITLDLHKMKKLLEVDNTILNIIKSGCRNGVCVKDTLIDKSIDLDKYLINNSTSLEIMADTDRYKEIVNKIKTIAKNEIPNESDLQIPLDELVKSS